MLIKMCKYIHIIYLFAGLSLNLLSHKWLGFFISRGKLRVNIIVISRESND